MKCRLLFSMLALIVFWQTNAQDPDATGILRSVLQKYYQNQKPIYKGRAQLLFVFCDRANNNEEIFEAVNKLKLPPETVKRIRREVTSDLDTQTWAAELEAIFATDDSKLAQKVNRCLSVEEYQQQRAKLNLNNQRLLILSKPVFIEQGKKALVKIVFYRTIEHNNGSVLLMEKINGSWVIKDQLNVWST